MQTKKSLSPEEAVEEYFDMLIKSRFIEMFGDSYISPKFDSVPFMECLIFNPGKNEVSKLSDNLEVSFVPMESVETDGSIDITQTKTLGEVRKGYTYFCENDVIFAKITPCFENGKVAVAKNCKNNIGFGSTEFHVLRPIEGKTTSIWLKYLLMSDSLRLLASSNMSGTAGQKRIQRPFFEKLKVGLPPIDLQNQFADFVNQVDKSKAVCKQIFQLFDNLVKSRFIEMFEEYVINKSYCHSLKSICIRGPQNGLYKKKGNSGIEVGIAKMSQAYGGECIDSKCDFETIRIDESEKRYLLKTGDLVFGRTSLVPGGAGDCSWIGKLDEPVLFESNLIRFSPNEAIVRSRYIYYWFHSEQGMAEIKRINNSVTVSSIKGTDLGNLSIPIPPICQQDAFLEFLEQVDKSKFSDGMICSR